MSSKMSVRECRIGYFMKESLIKCNKSVCEIISYCTKEGKRYNREGLFDMGPLGERQYSRQKEVCSQRQGSG